MKFIYLLLLFSIISFNGCSSSRKENPGENSREIEYTKDWSQKDSYRFLVLGDTQNPKSGEPQNESQRAAIFEEIIKKVSDSSAEFVMHTGDCVDKGGKVTDWQSFFDTLFWDKLNFEQKKKFFPALGNHEYKPLFLKIFGSGKKNLKPYFERFSHIRNKRYYYFYYGDACFIVLDSGKNGFKKLFGERWENDFEKQVDWLKNELFPEVKSRTNVKNIFVFFHKPGYATPVYLRNKDSAKILALFEDFNLENEQRFQIISFCGHIHTLSHIYVDYNGDDQNGIHQFTCGCGGGTQRGAKYYKKVGKVEQLDLYRQQKYEHLLSNGSFNKAAFDSVRLDNNIFGFIEVVKDSSIAINFHRYNAAEERFFIDYNYVF